VWGVACVAAAFNCKPPALDAAGSEDRIDEFAAEAAPSDVFTAAEFNAEGFVAEKFGNGGLACPDPASTGEAILSTARVPIAPGSPVPFECNLTVLELVAIGSSARLKPTVVGAIATTTVPQAIAAKHLQASLWRCSQLDFSEECTKSSGPDKRIPESYRLQEFQTLNPDFQFKSVQLTHVDAPAVDPRWSIAFC
jgi:hypothetical protein